MTERTYKIGDVSRRTGISVRRLRFYADQGLLPPAARSATGYRLFTDADLVRVDLIRALRDAGIGLSAIREVLSGSESMADILNLRLAELKAQIRSHQRTAAALAAILRAPDPISSDNLRRIWTMTNLSAAEYQAEIEGFIGSVSSDPKIGDAWRRRMASMTDIDLPQDPTAAQIDAWIELRELLHSPAFLNQMRENARDTDAAPLDAAVFQEVQNTILADARAALADGQAPDSPIGRRIARDYLAGWARALGVPTDDAYWERMRRKHLVHKTNTDRFWTLVYTIGGRQISNDPDPAWLWIGEAAEAFLAEI